MAVMADGALDADDWEDREDLAALLHRLLAVLVERETQLLAPHAVDMWEYVVLSGLEHAPAQTQNQLASKIGRDKTRLIPILDRLQARGLVDRRPDPLDRRNRIVRLTDAGRELLGRCRRDIRLMEAALLETLDPLDAKATVRALVHLARQHHGGAPSQ
jgi:DNA-binding MarR family transcriptional regulator